MATVLTTAENYAFGPIGALLSVAAHLRQAGHRILFVGDGTAYELAAADDVFDRVHRLDTASPAFEDAFARLLVGADFVVSSMDRHSVRAASRAGVPVVWVDILFSGTANCPTRSSTQTCSSAKPP